MTGVILGPSLIGLFEPSETIRLLAAIGIILLLFEVGLETDLQRMVTTGMKSLAGVWPSCDEWGRTWL
jgi:Kef-type K+ transport system membrane component KefB